jgi:hypothetical protein
VCDDINPLLVPTTDPPTQNDQVLKLRLTAAPPGGNGNLTPDPSLPDGTGCYPGIETMLPPRLCPYQLPVAISYAGGAAAVWALDPVDKNWCFGSQFDTLANNIQKGWACIAVRSTDKLGNRGVSRVLRVYVSEDGSAPAGGTGPKPDCTGAYDMTTKTVTPGACSARNYTYSYMEICPLNQKSGTVDCAGPAH